MVMFKGNEGLKFNKFRQYLKDRRGNVSMLFGLAAMPVFIASGMALDYNQANTVFSKSQQALDGAILAASVASTNGTEDIEIVGQNYFDANAPKNLAGIAKVHILKTADGISAGGNVTVAVKTSMLSIIGIDKMERKLESGAKLPVFSDNREGEIVFVMDYSGSMNYKVSGEPKYITMRNETIKLINNISQNSSNKHVKFGLVPFSSQVRVNMPRQNWTGKRKKMTNKNTEKMFTDCTQDRLGPFNTTNSTPNYKKKKSPTKWGWAKDKSTCSRMKTNKINVRPLEANQNNTINAIKSMEPYGNTHIAVGMAFAYHLLSPNKPFTDAQAFGTEGLVKAVVLLTDGRQTSPAYNKNGGSNNRSKQNGEDNLATLCTNMKKSGIRVFTVAFDLYDKDTVDRLKNCASSDDITKVSDAYTANTVSDMAETFGNITGKLARTMYLTE